MADPLHLPEPPPAESPSVDAQSNNSSTPSSIKQTAPDERGPSLAVEPSSDTDPSNQPKTKQCKSYLSASVPSPSPQQKPKRTFRSSTQRRPRIPPMATIRQGDHQCNLCSRHIRSAGHVFGLLERCDHVFCFHCITEWRRRHQTQQCPLCGLQSDRVLAWPTWVGCQKAKLRLLEQQEREWAEEAIADERSNESVTGSDEDSLRPIMDDTIRRLTLADVLLILFIVLIIFGISYGGYWFWKNVL